MERIIKILIERDGMTREEAVEVYTDVMEIVDWYIGHNMLEYAEQAFEDGFELELDYFPF